MRNDTNNNCKKIGKGLLHIQQKPNTKKMEATTGKITKADFYNTIFTAEGRDAKRDILKSLSNTAKMMLEMDPDLGSNLNDVIIEKMYKNQEHTEFHTFKGWQELGFRVKKGSKAFFIWSKPKKATKKTDNKETKETEEKQYKLFGLAYLFSNAQVEPLKTDGDD